MILNKLCECGCGNIVPFAPQTDKKRGWIKGEPKRFILNHHWKHPLYIQKSIEAHQTEEFRKKESLAKIGSLNPNWKGNHIKKISARQRALRNFKIFNCHICGEKAHDRHHIDENIFNNESENIQPLCRRCHMMIDGRMKKLIERMAKRKILSPPIIRKIGATS